MKCCICGKKLGDELGFNCRYGEHWDPYGLIEAMKQKTIRDVVEQDGKPVVERLPNGKFDVLCYGNDGSCKGCKYHKANSLKCCIAQCQDKDHIHWIHFKPVSSLKGTRVKQASEFDKIITSSGKKFTIVARSRFEFDVEPDEI